jgi:hypothetical protein
MVRLIGRRFSNQSARFPSFRGKTYGEIREAIGRPPDRVEGRYPERVRITWELSDDSDIHIDVPGVENDSTYQINREAHVTRTARAPNDDLHLSDDGIGVPTDSTAAHTTIQMDADLRRIIQFGLS